jgi:hypothetical protein
VPAKRPRRSSVKGRHARPAWGHSAPRPGTRRAKTAPVRPPRRARRSARDASGTPARCRPD